MLVRSPSTAQPRLSHCEVRRWLHCFGSRQPRWKGLQTGGWTASEMVLWEQSVSECYKDKRYWLMSGGCLLTTPRCSSKDLLWKESEKVHWCIHLWGPQLEPSTRTLLYGKTMPSLPEETQMHQSVTTCPHYLIQRNCWQCIDQLHHCVVWELQAPEWKSLQ